MKRLSASIVSFFLLVSSILAIVQPGDSLEKMREEFGEPTAQILKGNTTIFSYPQGVVHVERGRVVQLSEGFYGRLDQMSKQTSEGRVDKSVGEGLLVVENPPVKVEEDGGAATKGEWLNNFEEAHKLAVRLNRPLLLLFTVSDDGGACKELDSRILPDPVFVDFAKEHLVLLRVDSPTTWQLPKEVADQNLILKEVWSVQTFPTLLVMDRKKTELGRMGYEHLASEALVHLLDQMIHGKPESPEAAGMEVLKDEFGKGVDLAFLDKMSGRGLMLAAQVIAGMILGYMLIRRFVNK